MGGGGWVQTWVLTSASMTWEHLRRVRVGEFLIMLKLFSLGIISDRHKSGKNSVRIPRFSRFQMLNFY